MQAQYDAIGAWRVSFEASQVASVINGLGAEAAAAGVEAAVRTEVRRVTDQTVHAARRAVLESAEREKAAMEAQSGAVERSARRWALEVGCLTRRGW